MKKILVGEFIRAAAHTIAITQSKVEAKVGRSRAEAAEGRVTRRVCEKIAQSVAQPDFL
jgi:hypothetical protein